VLAFGLLALSAELVGRVLVHTADVGRHVQSPVPAGASYYPILLVVIKVGVALLVARLLWRVARAHTAGRAAGRLLTAMGAERARAPRPRMHLSPRLWLAFFLVTSLIYLVQADVEQAGTGRWPLLHPWLHTSALPIFAALAVILALLWGAVQRWLEDLERHAEDAVARVRRLSLTPEITPWRREPAAAPPRRLFGLAIASRPPPAPAPV
jgi:hypothetical protein